MATRVIIVEDEPIVALDLRRMLEDLGFIVDGVFADGERAIAACVASPPDVALMDIRILGGTDGLTAAEEIYVCSRVPVVLVSAYGDHETVARACRAGAYAFVTKPFASVSLGAAVELALAKHAEIRRIAQTVDVLRAAVDHGAAAILVTDGARRVCHVSPRAAQLLGTAPPAALDRDLGDLLGDLDAWASPAALAAQRPGATIAGVARHGDRVVPVVIARSTASALWVWTFEPGPGA